MSRRRSQQVASFGDYALTWFFVGVLIIAVVASVLGNASPV